MKRLICFLLAAIMLLGLCGCDLISFEYIENDSHASDTGNSPTPSDDVSREALENAEATIEEDGTYISPAEVAAYLHTYEKLPSNFITKSEAKKLGWNSKDGNLDEVAPGCSIGGDTFGNRENKLPSGEKYYECDVNYTGGYRSSERIIYTKDGDIYYTNDHYESFEKLY